MRLAVLIHLQTHADIEHTHFPLHLCDSGGLTGNIKEGNGDFSNKLTRANNLLHYSDCAVWQRYISTPSGILEMCVCVCLHMYYMYLSVHACVYRRINKQGKLTLSCTSISLMTHTQTHSLPASLYTWLIHHSTTPTSLEYCPTRHPVVPDAIPNWHSRAW